MKSEWITTTQAATIVGCQISNITKRIVEGSIQARWSDNLGRWMVWRKSAERYARRRHPIFAKIERRRANAEIRP